MDRRDVPDVSPAPAGRSSGNRPRNSDRRATSLRTPQETHCRSPAQAWRGMEALSIHRLLVSVAQPGCCGAAPAAKGFTLPAPGKAREMTKRHVAASLTVIATLAALYFGRLYAQQDKSNDKKWDVAADLGPVTKLTFDTSEGTWMNVDVSPDGTRIVFDLLGDIYMMPIDGAATSPATR